MGVFLFNLIFRNSAIVRNLWKEGVVDSEIYSTVMLTIASRLKQNVIILQRKQ